MQNLNVAKHRNREALVILTDHSGDAEQIDEPPNHKSAKRKPEYDRHPDSANISVMQAEEEPEHTGHEGRFFLFIELRDKRLRLPGFSSRNKLIEVGAD